MDTTIPDVSVMRIAVDLAGRAPSVHNSQPWHWTYSNGRLDLHTDRARLLPQADPLGRQLVISCGTALHHLEAALTTLRWTTTVERFPDGPGSEHLATLRFRRDAHPVAHDFDLLAAIRHRHSDRRPFGPLDADHRLPSALPDMAAGRAVRVTVLPSDARSTLAAATRLTASTRRYDAAYHAELHWWTGHFSTAGGIPPEALATSRNRSRVDIGREFPDGADDDSVEDTDRSTVLVLSTEADHRPDWLRAGETLSLVLLEATIDGLATCPLTHLTELTQSREMVRSLIPEGGFPQVLIRVGVAKSGRISRETPRRPMDTALSVTPRPLHP